MFDPILGYSRPENADQLNAEVEKYLESGKLLPDDLAQRLEDAWGEFD